MLFSLIIIGSRLPLCIAICGRAAFRKTNEVRNG